MKAVTVPRYGAPDVLEVTDIPVPEPGPDQVRVRVLSSSVNPVDWHSIRGEPLLVRLSQGLMKPRHPGIGTDLAGVVDAVGPGVTSVRPGDEVLGMSIRTWAELVVVKAEGLVPKPAGVSFEAAGAVGVAALTALQGIRDHGRLVRGQRVLVAGAGGGVGHFGVQIARALGAEVTAATTPANQEWVRALGADEVIDYTRVDPTGSRDRYDLIFDAGGWLTLGGMRRALKPGGIAVTAGGGRHPTMVGIVAGMGAGAVANRIGSRRFVTYLAHRTREDLETLAAWLAAGTIRPVIDRRYALAEIRDAVRYQETGQARGKVVVSVAAE